MKPCFCCDKGNHNSTNCRFADASCHYCKKKGYLATVCLKKERDKKKLNTKHIKAASEDSNSEPKLCLNRINELTSEPIMVTLEMEGISLQIKLDTGAAYSIISEQMYHFEFSGMKLHSSYTLLKTYTAENIAVLGQLNVHVHYGKQFAHLVLLVVAGDGPSLLGRNWLHYIKLDWKKIHAVSKSIKLTDFLHHNSHLFREELGEIQHYEASFQICPDACPQFFKAGPVPFAIKPSIEDELDELEASGVIKKVEHSQWAAPIVPVPKKNGKFRICGDYKVTVNQVLDVDQYPLPKPDDFFAILAGGKMFSKLDLSQAYQQLTLDEESTKYVTINTHCGLYRYTRLPFGVASAPALFQKLIDVVLQGIPHVICYIDDILVTGSNNGEHLHNLARVFEHLSHHGFRLKKNKCEFLKDSVEFLGHKIDAEGLHVLPDKVEAIASAPKPQNIQELRSFLGLLNYYGKFIPNLSTTVHPLNCLLQHKKK